MSRAISHFFSDRQGSAPALMVFLLTVAVVAGDSALVASLRGISTADPASGVHSVGYYEALINAGQSLPVEDGLHPPPGWRPFGGDETGIVREVPTYLRWEMKPNLDFRWNGTVFRTNSRGFRTPDVTLEKPKGTYRILVFGSSNTMGYGVDSGVAYVRLLERWLNERSGPAHRVEVVNLAVAGDSPTRRLERIRKEAGRWNADWLLCDATALDSWLEDNHIHSVLERHIPIPYPFVNEAIRRSGVTGTESLEVFREKFKGESEKMLGAVYAAWSEEASRLHVPLTVLILPRADSNARSPRVFQLIRTLCGATGLDFLDISAAFDDLEADEFRISEWDKHPNDNGHQVIFEALRDALLSRGGLPGPMRSVASH